MSSSLWVVAAAVLMAAWEGARGTERPIVGVLAQEVQESAAAGRGYTSYIAADYVKAVESSGARVVPVFVRRPPQYYRKVMSEINALLIPGGSADFSSKEGIAAAAATLYKLAIQVNDKGGFFPILGVCQGMELLAYLSGGGSSAVLEPCSAQNLSLPLVFRAGARNSSLYAAATDDEIAILQDFPVTPNHHQKCVTERSLGKVGAGGLWRVLTTNRDEGGLEFVSSMEDARGYPFAAVQFHPEKVAFEWSLGQINPHSGKAVRSSRVFYDWLAREARKSPASFPDLSTERDALIFNYSPVFTGARGGYDTQTYYFL